MAAVTLFVLSFRLPGRGRVDQIRQNHGRLTDIRECLLLAEADGGGARCAQRSAGLVDLLLPLGHGVATAGVRVRVRHDGEGGEGALRGQSKQPDDTKALRRAHQQELRPSLGRPARPHQLPQRELRLPHQGDPSVRGAARQRVPSLCGRLAKHGVARADGEVAV